MAATDTRFVRGAEKLSRRISTIRARLALPPLVNEIGGLLLRRNLERFDREEDPDGVPWVPLAASTVILKRRLGYGTKGTLKRTEHMRDAIKLIRGNASGALYINTGARVRIGIDDPEIERYARVHQNGNMRVPRRRFLGIGRLDVKAVDSFLRRRGQQAVSEN